MELAFVALIAIATCVPLWRGRAPGRVSMVWAGLLSALALMVVIGSFVLAPELPRVSSTRPLVAAGSGYTGSASCRSCHPEQHATWRESFHATMTQVATRSAVVAKFEQLDLDWFGKPVQLRWSGDTLWVEFERGGRRPGPVRRPVEQLTGSHHLQVLWYSTGAGRELAPVPMCFKIEEGVWLPLSAVFVLPPEYRDPPEPGAWNQNCHMCHATDVRPRVDIDRCDTEVTELGIACEACHGAGGPHVAANRNPLRRYEQRTSGAPDPTIVQPTNLEPARSAQVCGQCHSVNILHQEFFDSWREQGLVYRPGGDLDATNLVIDSSQRRAPELVRTLQKNPNFFASAFWSDGQVRLSGREFNGLRMSPCYTRGHGDKQLTCTSCHSLHREADVAREEWADDQLKPGMRGNVACTQCHEAMREPAALAAHTHHAPESTGSTCYNCHMPHTTFGLMKAMRSHTITSPDVGVELATGRPNACNQCHLDRTLDWTNERLARWYGKARVELDADQKEVAAAARWLLSGDAGQRAIAAWSFGWPDAQKAAGTDWPAPYLARLLDDPYYVVRFAAARSLRSLPGGAQELDGYDFLASAAKAGAFVSTVQARWRTGFRGGARGSVLIAADGSLGDAFARLYARRDDRPVYLSE
jgi:hypothetical protein